MLDDAQALLDDLSDLVEGNILVAHDQLNNLRYEVVAESINVRLQAEIDIEQEHQVLDLELTNLKELAFAAEADISSCLEGNEDKLAALPDSYTSSMSECITTLQQGSDTTLNDTRYQVDVVYSSVRSLSFALDQCRRDEECISGVIDQIKAATEDLPLQIQVYVDGAEDEMDIVKVKIQNCADTNLANFVLEGSQIMDEITDCVNDII